jgi:uncharacterized protein YkwD
MALERGQRQLVAGLVAVLVVLGVVTAAVALVGDGGSNRQGVATAAGPSPTTTTAPGSDTTAVEPATGSAAAPTTTTAAAPGASPDTTARGAGKAAKGGKGAAVTSSTIAAQRDRGGGAPTSSSTTARAPSTTASAGPCTTGGSGQDDQIATLYCAYRHDQGLAPMSRNGALDGVAQRWAAKMAADADAAVAAGQDPSVALAHNLAGTPGSTYPGGYSAAVKADCSGCTGWAENVAYDTSAAAAWNGWLGSSSHLADIRGGPHGGEFGVGAAQGGGYWWYVQDFGFYP